MSFLLELARVLKERTNAVTIEILFLDGEEAFGEWETGNTFGSRHYVDAAKKDGTLKDIKAMILVDMIGDKALGFKRESRSTPWLTDAIWAAARELKRPEFLVESTPIDDDHLPFLTEGVPATDIIDLEYPDASSRYWQLGGGHAGQRVRAEPAGGGRCAGGAPNDRAAGEINQGATGVLQGERAQGATGCWRVRQGAARCGSGAERGRALTLRCTGELTLRCCGR